VPLSRRISAPFFVVAISLFAAISLQASAQTTIWRNDWTVSAPPTLQYPVPPLVTFGSDGDVLIGSASPNNLDYQFVRLTSAGAVRWSANLGGVWGVYGGVADVLANADGSAFVIVGDSFFSTGNFIAKIDASGAIEWTRQISASSVARQSPQLIATAGCRAISSLNASSGQLAWQYIYTVIPNTCLGGGAAGDGQGNVYAIVAKFTPGSSQSIGFRILKFGLDGHVAWDISTTSTETPRLVGVAGSVLYLTTATSARAIRVGDGSTAWITSYPDYPGLSDSALVGSPAELVTISTTAAQRLSADSGLPRWSQPTRGKLNIVNDGIVLNSANNLIKLDTETGLIKWTSPLPDSDESGEQQDFFLSGPSADGNIMTVAKPSFASYTSASPIFLQQVDSNNGEVLNHVPVGPVSQGVAGISIKDDATHATALAVINGQMHVRRLNTLSGSQEWESLDASFQTDTRFAPGITVARDAIAAAITSAEGAVRVDAFDRITGTLRWGTWLGDFYQHYTQASDPVADAGGNVFIDYGADSLCQPLPFYPPTYCQRQTLAKLSAIDGSVIWQYVNASSSDSNNNVYPQTFAMAGSDVLLIGPFAGANASSTLIKFSGLDGSILWKSSISPIRGILEIFPMENGDITLVGDVLARIDGATGNTISINSYENITHSCSVGCEINDLIALPNGDILYLGEDNYQPSITLWHNEAGGFDEQSYLGQGSPALSSYVYLPTRDAAGQMWLRLSNRFRNESRGVTFFARLDLSGAKLLGQQVLSVFSSDPVIFSPTYDTLSLAPENNRLLTGTMLADSPLPTTSGNALLDTTVTANGDLSMQLTLDHSKVKTGDTVGFHFIATYSGDAPISGAHLRGYLPWVGGISAVNCVAQKASNCVIDTRSGNIQASFDIKPGGKIDISGQVRALIGSDNPFVEGFVYGPTGLMEQDTINNFARTGLVESIFFGGFE